MSWFKRLIGTGDHQPAKPQIALEPDQFPLAPDDPRAEFQRELSAILIAELPRALRHESLDRKGIIAKLVQSRDRDQIRELVLAFCERQDWLKKEESRIRSKHQRGSSLHHQEYEAIYRCRYILSLVLQDITRRELPFSEADIVQLAGNVELVFGFSRVTYLTIIERHVDIHGVSATIRRVLEQLRVSLGPWSAAEMRRLEKRIEKLLAAGATATSSGEKSGDSRKNDKNAAAPSLDELCDMATSGSPTRKWLSAATSFINQRGPAHLRDEISPRLSLDVPSEVAESKNELQLIRAAERHADTLKGLVWCCGLFDDAETARALTRLALSAYKKLPGIGPRCVRVGNACIWALGNMPGREGLAQLAILKARVKFGTAQKLIAKALNAVATRLNLPGDVIEELAVPQYGLTSIGQRSETLGEFTASINVTGSEPARLQFARADGKPLKTVPAAVKQSHANDLKELKLAARDIDRMVAAQRERLDMLFLTRRTWPFQSWRERYADHPLVGVLARRLIWRFTHDDRTTDAVLVDGNLRDVQGGPVGDLPAESTVELWHPINAQVDDVLAWRIALEKHGITQPFKQAHREIYVLTDAERTTQTYSNRFAAHVLRQHQFNALCGVREWRNKLRLMVDAEYPPAMRFLPAWNLRAEYWIEGIGEDYHEDANESGVFNLVATDQVRFYAADAAQLTAHASGGGYGSGRHAAPEPLPLDQIPPLVFSEVMRDVDLFVGVASVGNNPAWNDGGPEGRFRDYWTQYAFGELGESAKTRRAILERLIPRLSIADQCSFSDRFLIVRGELRSYKIHLGSGNILMTPNDQYLCIVQSGRIASGPGGKVFLPFEGDERLSVILSKVFLLAHDTRITDPTILRQIRAC